MKFDVQVPGHCIFICDPFEIYNERMLVHSLCKRVPLEIYNERMLVHSSCKRVPLEIYNERVLEHSST